MAVSVDTQLTNIPLYAGSPLVKTAETLLTDAGRVTDMVYGTILAYDPVAAKWSALTDVTQSLFTPALLTCGANGGNLAAWQAVTAGAFTITVDGTAVALTALDFSSITVLPEVADTINYAANGRVTCMYDSKADVFKFISPTAGLSSAITVLVAPAAGTDISGAGFLNGLTTVGTVTAATGSNALKFPAGILAKTLTAAAIAAADVEDVPVWYGGGADAIFDRNQITLENSLTLADVIYANNTHKSIEEYLNGLGIFFDTAVAVDGFENT